jgi:lipopolysaccharide export system permease protein
MAAGTEIMLRIVDKYLLREFLLYLLLGLVSFIGIYVIVDLFEKIDTFVDHKAAAPDIIDYYLNNIPLIVVQVLPVAMLLGAVLALGHLRKFNEITAMQACGLSPLRIIRPILIVAALITAGAFALTDYVVPGAYERQKEIYDVKIKKKRISGRRGNNDIRYMSRGGRVYVAKEYRPHPPTLNNVLIQHFTSGEKKTLERRVDAMEGRWRHEFWEMSRGFVRYFHDGTEVAVGFKYYADSRYNEQPDVFSRPHKDPLDMNLDMSRAELADYIQRIEESGAKVARYVVNYHLHIAFPLANFVMVLLGSCLSLRIIRGTMALGFGISISLGFAYYGLLRVGQALGHNGDIPPLPAAWLGNIVFLVIGVLLFWRMNR